MESCSIKRADFINTINSYPHDKVYYIDECGIDNYLYREYAYALRGTKVIGKVSGKKYKRTNIVAAKCGSDIIAPMIYDGTTDSLLFEQWFKEAFLPVIPKGSYCVLDNATFHRKKKLHQLAFDAGCSVLFLPPYSPDLNPIEKHWAWLKNTLRKVLPFFECFIDALCYCF